jgi:hypothetical protein
MKYPSGEDVRLGDRVKFGSWSHGTVVCSIDDDQYSPEYPKSSWAYLGRGVMVLTDAAGLIHYEEPDGDMELVSRASETV